MKKGLELIIIDAFGETFLELVLQKRISSEQFKLLLERSQEKIQEGMNNALQERALELEQLKAQFKTYDQKN